MGDEPSNEYEAINKRFDEVLNWLKQINDRLFVDNGNLSIQTRLDRHGRWIKVAMAITTAISLAILGIATFVIKAWIVSKVEGG